MCLCFVGSVFVVVVVCFLFYLGVVVGGGGGSWGAFFFVPVVNYFELDLWDTLPSKNQYNSVALPSLH